VLRIGGGGEGVGDAIDGDGSGIHRVDARERLDEGGLARSVLAHQRVDLACAEGEVDVVEREDSGEADGDAPHRDDGWRLGGLR
jgi:hypothetical protein